MLRRFGRHDWYASVFDVKPGPDVLRGLLWVKDILFIIGRVVEDAKMLNVGAKGWSDSDRDVIDVVIVGNHRITDSICVKVYEVDGWKERWIDAISVLFRNRARESDVCPACVERAYVSRIVSAFPFSNKCPACVERAYVSRIVSAFPFSNNRTPEARNSSRKFKVLRDRQNAASWSSSVLVSIVSEIGASASISSWIGGKSPYCYRGRVSSLQTSWI
jgi:hypothetical protein